MRIIWLLMCTNIRTLMGEEGRLIEILSEEDQELAVALMKATEATFSIETDLAYWWSGLKDDDDDGQWVWAGSNDHQGELQGGRNLFRKGNE